MDYHPQDRNVLLADARRLVEEFPDLYLLATEQARQLLARHGAGEVDPEHVWWHRFDNAVSDPSSFTGWVHYDRPVQSLTLVELVLERFRASDQDNLDLLDQMGGLYTAGPGQGFYHQGNEVPVLARDLANDFWAVDFAGAYHQRLQRFWSRNGREHARLARVAFLASLGRALRGGQLSAEAGELARQGLVSTFDGTADVARLARPSAPLAGISVRLLAVDGFVARDIVRVSNARGLQVLYTPGDAQPLQAFDSPQALYRWLATQAAQSARRALLATHFSAFNAAHDPALIGLRATLARMANDHQGLLLGLIEGGGETITHDPFDYLSAQAKAQMIEQSSTLLVDNAQLRKQMWIGYLGAFISLGSAFAPLGWPVALTLVGASTTAMVLNIQQAVVARTAQQRRQAILAAIGNGINAVFNLVFIAVDAAPALDEDGTASVTEPAQGDIELQALQPRVPARPQTAFNSLGLMERRNLPGVYKPLPFPRGTDVTRPLKQGFEPATRFDQAQRMIDGPLLQVFASRMGALEYAKMAFDGPFMVYEIDAHGLAAVSLRENLSYNTAVVLEREGYPADFVAQRLTLGQSLDDFANDGWRFDEVHLQLEGLHPSRITLVPAAELEPQREALAAWSLPGTQDGVLNGVRVRAPQGGQAVTQYSISITGGPQRVRYDPFRGCWRDDSGHAWRRDPVRNAFEVIADPAAEPLLSAGASAARLKELGIEVQVPFQVAPPVMAGARPIPRVIHSFWLGRHMPRAMVDRVLANAREAAQGANPFQSRLYLSIADADELKLTLERLGDHPTGLTILNLEDSEFFQAFRQGRYYEHFVAASSWQGGNLASAVDVLRYAVLDYSGGLYMDVDDAIVSAATGQRLASLPLHVRPGELLLNAPVRHRTLGMVVDFNNSNFGSLPNNPVLRQMSELAWQRFKANTRLYRERPYEFLDSPRQMQAYAAQISRTTGPALFNEVIARELPALRNFRNLNRVALGEVYLASKALEQLREQLARVFQGYCPLAGLIRIGATGSWMRTR